MVTAYVRGYLKKKDAKEKKYAAFHIVQNDSDYSIFIDTETTTDIYQNLKVGFYMVCYKENTLVEIGFFYVPERCTKEEITILKSYCVKNRVALYEHNHFIEKVFFKYALFKKALCVFFNAPFDISRIAIASSFTKGGKFHNGFSFTLTKNKSYPRIKITANCSDNALIEFCTAA